jgi:hypothetical protein
VIVAPPAIVGIVISKVVAVKFDESITVNVSSVGTVPALYVKKSQNNFCPISKLCPPETVIVQVALVAEYVAVVAVTASSFCIDLFEYVNQISSIYAPLIEVSVNAESTSNTFVALPTAVGIKLVKKDCPDETVHSVELVAGRSTINGCLFELLLATFIYS